MFLMIDPNPNITYLLKNSETESGMGQLLNEHAEYATDWKNTTTRVYVRKILV